MGEGRAGGGGIRRLKAAGVGSGCSSRSAADTARRNGGGGGGGTLGCLPEILVLGQRQEKWGWEGQRRTRTRKGTAGPGASLPARPLPSLVASWPGSRCVLSSRPGQGCGIGKARQDPLDPSGKAETTERHSPAGATSHFARGVLAGEGPCSPPRPAPVGPLQEQQLQFSLPDSPARAHWSCWGRGLHPPRPRPTSPRPETRLLRPPSSLAPCRSPRAGLLTAPVRPAEAASVLAAP